MHKTNEPSVRGPKGQPYTAKYLVLLHRNQHQRALLFNGQHDFLAELDDDGFVINDLVRSGTPCLPPSSLPLSDISLSALRDHDSQLKCYRLG